MFESISMNPSVSLFVHDGGARHYYKRARDIIIRGRATNRFTDRLVDRERGSQKSENYLHVHANNFLFLIPALLKVFL